MSRLSCPKAEFNLMRLSEALSHRVKCLFNFLFLKLCCTRHCGATTLKKMFSSHFMQTERRKRRALKKSDKSRKFAHMKLKPKPCVRPCALCWSRDLEIYYKHFLSCRTSSALDNKQRQKRVILRFGHIHKVCIWLYEESENAPMKTNRKHFWGHSAFFDFIARWICPSRNRDRERDVKTRWCSWRANMRLLLILLLSAMWPHQQHEWGSARKFFTIDIKFKSLSNLKILLATNSLNSVVIIRAQNISRMHPNTWNGKYRSFSSNEEEQNWFISS